MTTTRTSDHRPHDRDRRGDQLAGERRAVRGEADTGLDPQRGGEGRRDDGEHADGRLVADERDHAGRRQSAEQQHECGQEDVGTDEPWTTTEESGAYANQPNEPCGCHHHTAPSATAGTANQAAHRAAVARRTDHERRHGQHGDDAGDHQPGARAGNRRTGGKTPPARRRRPAPRPRRRRRGRACSAWRQARGEQPGRGGDPGGYSPQHGEREHPRLDRVRAGGGRCGSSSRCSSRGSRCRRSWPRW